MSFLRDLFRMTTKHYELKALVSSRFLEPLSKIDSTSDSSVQLFCDLDKTYLETEFESWIKMAKIPFESPHDKITVPCASEVLELVRWGGDPRERSHPNSAIHFVSSSPPQLRLALDGKLALDRLEWTSDTFKNQTYNLRMARIDLLRHHIAYKSKAILDIAVKLPSHSRIIMIGDNAEYDAFIYTGVRLFLERRVDGQGFREWLKGAKVEDAVISQVLSQGIEVPENLKVLGIFIRNVPGYRGSASSRFDGSWHRFDHWLQVAWTMMIWGLIDPRSLPKIVRSCHNIHGVPLAHIRWCLQQSIHRQVETTAIPERLQHEAAQLLVDLTERGASGPTRRMLAWTLDEVPLKPLPDHEMLAHMDKRVESMRWYQSIEELRQERKRARD